MNHDQRCCTDQKRCLLATDLAWRYNDAKDAQQWDAMRLALDAYNAHMDDRGLKPVYVTSYPRRPDLWPTWVPHSDAS